MDEDRGVAGGGSRRAALGWQQGGAGVLQNHATFQKFHRWNSWWETQFSLHGNVAGSVFGPHFHNMSEAGARRWKINYQRQRPWLSSLAVQSNMFRVHQ